MPPTRRHPARDTIASLLAGVGLVAIAFAAGPARASDLRMTVERPHFTCESGAAPLSRLAAWRGGPHVAKPVLPCCDGQLGCAQFLSTNTVLHSPRQWHS